mgnify:CR=1 FL=1
MKMAEPFGSIFYACGEDSHQATKAPLTNATPTMKRGLYANCFSGSSAIEGKK